MNRLTAAFLIATAALAISGCGSSGSSGETGSARTPITELARTMIDQATSEDCPTEAHCVRWPVDDLATVTQPDDADTLDL